MGRYKNRFWWMMLTMHIESLSESLIVKVISKVDPLGFETNGKIVMILRQQTNDAIEKFGITERKGIEADQE